MVSFANLNIGDRFLYKDEVWIKVKPKKKSCCTVLYNAWKEEDNSAYRVFRPTEQVEKL